MSNAGDLWLPEPKKLYLGNGRWSLDLALDPTLNLYVAASEDDARQLESSGVMNITSTYTTCNSSAFAVSRNWGGLRWVSASLPPQGATISVAYAQLYVYSTSYDDINGDLHFELGADPAAFTTTGFDITNRSRTLASAAWVQDTLGTGWKQTPSLVSALQEVVDSYSPSALVLILKPKTDTDKFFRAYSYDQDSAYGALLHIEGTWEVPAVGRSQGYIIG